MKCDVAKRQELKQRILKTIEANHPAD